MRRLLSVALSLVAMAMVVFSPAVVQAKGKVKVDICHIDEDGFVIPLNIAEPAVDAHLGHGDYFPFVSFADFDGDGYGDAAMYVVGCETPDGYVENDLDCAVDDPALPMAYYEDADGDGFGNAEASVLACAAPAGYVEDNTDPDDTDPNVPVPQCSPETAMCGDVLCSSLPWAVYMDGLFWAWASPCSGGCSQLKFPIPYGFRLATWEEWQNGAAGPQSAADFNYQCAAKIFDNRYSHCDAVNLNAGKKVSPEYPANYYWETLLVHDVVCD